jgi:AcrR family transcriptional regulator
VNEMHNQDSESRILRTVWGLTTPPPRGPRAKYAVGDVAAAAVSLADADGLAGVVLSAVAAELQLTTTALYRYVDSKETLVELMVDAALGPAPTLDVADWRAGVEAWVRALWIRYREHPWIAEVPVAGMPRHPQRLGWMEALLRQLDRGPISDPMHTALLLDAVTRSFTLLARPVSRRDAPPPWLLEVAAARFPRLARELQRDWTNIEEELTAAIRTVLLGSERTSQSEALRRAT